MRIFTGFKDAFNEIRRDLGEMGIPVETQTMQNKDIAGDDDFRTKELQNYIYCVTHPSINDIDSTQPWAHEEWKERWGGINGRPVNPGEAWKYRKHIWTEFLDDNGQFDYTYSERFSKESQVINVIRRLQEDNYSRQLYVAMWTPEDSARLGVLRVPCSLGWLFQFRRGKLDITYFMRSCDFHTHFYNDVYLSMQLLHYVAHNANLPPGKFTHFMGSLHIYEKDLGHVF